jgi:hypothetical protein
MPWKAFGGGRAQDKLKRETTSRGNDEAQSPLGNDLEDMFFNLSDRSLKRGTLTSSPLLRGFFFLQTLSTKGPA